MAGLEDWDAIETDQRDHQVVIVENPAHLIGEAAQQYAEDPWREHDVRLFSVRFGGDATHKYSGR